MGKEIKHPETIALHGGEYRSDVDEPKKTKERERTLHPNWY